MAYINKSKKFSGGLSNNQTLPQIIKFEKTILPSGLRILTEEVPSVESFALGICIDAGSRDDTPGLEGITHFLEHAAFRRTKNRTTKQIASQFESLGAYTNAFTSKEHTCFYVRALKQHFAKTLKILYDVAMEPLFVGSDIEKERQIILEEIISYEDEPEELIFDYGDKSLFENNSLSVPITGYKDTINKIGISDLQEFHSNYYTPQNMIVSVAGNISHSEVTENVSRIFKESNYFESNKNKREMPLINIPSKYEYKRQLQQSHILFGRMISGAKSEERYILALLNVLLGDGLSSRLHQVLREKYGFAYTIYSTIQLFSDVGSFYIYAGLDKKNISKTEKIIKNEFDKIIQKGITKSELQRAKEQLKSSLIMNLESMSARMQTLAKTEFIGEEYEDLGTIIRLIDATAMDEMNDSINKYLQFESWSEVIFKSA